MRLGSCFTIATTAFAMTATCLLTPPMAQAATRHDKPWTTSFETSQPAPSTSKQFGPLVNVSGTGDDGAPLVAKVGGGPTSGFNIHKGTGFTGTHGLQFSGVNRGAGPARGADSLYDNVGRRISNGDELSYKVFPERGSSSSYASTYVAIDLVFTDGTRMSATPDATDTDGSPISASGHGLKKVLYTDQWNSIHIDLSRYAGKTVDKVIAVYDNPDDGGAGQKFSAWFDDLSVQRAPKTDLTNRASIVDTRRGTLSSGDFSRGNNLPATAMPNGFNFFTPMTNGKSRSWEYTYASSNNDANLPSLQGIGVSHEPSPWMGDRNQLAIMPSPTAQPTSTLTDRALTFDHDDETARPDLYSVKFTDGLKASVTPSDHAGVYQFTFPGSTGSVLLDKVAGDSKLHVDADGTVSGWVDNGNSDGATRMFVYGEFDRTPTKTGDATGDRADSARYASFDTSSDRTVELRLATSFISTDQAKHNLNLEVARKSFKRVQQAANTAWNKRLGVIDVTGAGRTQLQSLYSNLYRMNLYPNSQFENVGTAAKPQYQHASPVLPTKGDATDSATNAQVKPGKIYVNNGFWDTYRTEWPAYSLLYPKLADELVDGFAQQYREGGWVARWSSPGYADLMTGTSSDTAFAEAYLEGSVDTKTALTAYDAALKNATVRSTDSAVGRKGLRTSPYAGYTSTSTGESVSWSLEDYINDAGIARMATKLANDPKTPKNRIAQLRNDAAYLTSRSKDYVNLFNPDTDFFQGRNADGSWHTFGGKPFDPTSWGDVFTETDGWNFAFHPTYDIPGLESLYGGSKGLIAKLDKFFATPETASNPGGYGGTIHEMREAAAVRMGQLGMSNQPSHHIPYVYAAAGKPSATQAKVREITRRLFVGSDIGEGYAGDEDNGETSSWYIFSALGFYPMSVGSGQYVIGSPLFRTATVHLAGGRKLTIDARNNSPQNVYIQSATLNGKPLQSATIDASLLQKGGDLSFQMGPKPSTWAASSSKGTPAKPLYDATTPGYGTTTSSDGTSTTALTDDDSSTDTTFTSKTPTVTWRSGSGPMTVNRYTITNGSGGGTPTAWTLEGSSDGGKSWATLDKQQNQTFRWDDQLVPYSIAKPGSYDAYRLRITASTGGAPTLSEFELSADPAGKQGDLAVSPVQGLKSTVGSKVTSPLAVVSGVPEGATSVTATADFHDGKGPQPATVSRTPLGRYAVSAPHTFDVAGLASVDIAASVSGKQVSTPVEIAVSRDQLFADTMNGTCIGLPGSGADCDAGGVGFSRTSLADNGFVQGETEKVPGTDLSFDIPKPVGGNDNVVADGQTVMFDPGTDATKISVIGTATQKDLSGTATMHFSDGSTAPLAIGFGDWVGAAGSPKFGNIVVGKSAGRVSSGGTDSLTAAIFSTAPVELPSGKKLVSITLPPAVGTASSDGRIHVFAFASNGSRSAAYTPIALTAKTVADQPSGTSFTAELATVTGGSGTPTATVNWGDGSAMATADVTKSADGWSITGGHSYAKAGTYTVTVTADDGVKSEATTTKITVS
ncbi:MAG TPA: GH92 family glycosyl hydrolase [Flexivirga sp.]|uniref:GH92 family glycosyl hydrolase n=1 Tax=Flexivirga sp. TaxID=1962927 RepID=UPI002B5FB100|nr:GH92 family glycosyl hydrolase [Flexivirga sp.]HWC24326.1 GH92 family glycosyl hydrolase [Flexivirga sp.]